MKRFDWLRLIRLGISFTRFPRRLHRRGLSGPQRTKRQSFVAVLVTCGEGLESRVMLSGVGDQQPSAGLDVAFGVFTPEEIAEMEAVPANSALGSKTPAIALDGGHGPTNDILTIVLDFNDPGQANTSDVFGNVVSTFDVTAYGFAAGDFDMVTSAILAEVDDDYFTELVGTAAGPTGQDLEIDFIIGDIGTAPVGISEYYYVQIGSGVSGPHIGALGVANSSGVRTSTGANGPRAVGDVVGSIFSGNIQGLFNLTPSNALTSGNLTFTTNAVSGTVSHEIGHTISLSHINKAGSVQPGGSPPSGPSPIMGTGAIDLPNQDRITDRQFSLSGVDGQNGNAPRLHIQQLVDAVGLHTFTLPSELFVTIDLASMSENGGMATGTVTRSTGTSGTLVVSVLSSDISEATVPAIVTIPDGSNSATFTITAVDDAIADGTQTVTVTAIATGFTPGADTIIVTDDEVPTLTVTIDMASISENGGLATGTVTRNTPTIGNLVVTLMSDDLTEAFVPVTVTIPNGSSSATFTITGVDDAIIDGTQPVTVTALAGGFVAGTAMIDVLDDDAPRLTMVIDMASISEVGGIATGTVTRSTGTVGTLVVNLSSDDMGEATVPATVMIPDGSDSATFTITGVDDVIADGTQTVTITAAAAGLVDGTATLGVTDDEVPELTVAINMASIGETGMATGTVTRNTDGVGDLVVNLSSNDTGEATVPATVTIPDGALSATFAITGVDDGIVDGTQTVTVTSSSSGFTPGADMVDVTDDNVPTLSVTIDMASISENGGMATGTVTRNTGTVGMLVVNLSSDDTTEATVPVTVTIPNGSNSATFTITGVDDVIIDGTQTVTVTATAGGFVAGTDMLDVTNDDVPALTVTIDMASFNENGGTATGTVTRNTGTVGALVINLTSSDTGKAAVPVTVTIPNGAVSSMFTITGIDDAIADGTQTVTVTAVAAGFTNGSQAIDVTDDDVPLLSLSIVPASISESGGAATATLTRNTLTNGDLVVTVMSSDTTEASVPLIVTIPAGSASTTFAVTAVNDAVVDGTQTATITASVGGFVAGTDTVDVTDVTQFILTDQIYVNDNFTQPDGTIIPDADPNTAGNQTATIGVNAFDTVQEGVDAVDDGGIVHVTDDLASDGPGIYAENLLIAKAVTVIGTEGIASAVVIDGSAAGSVVTIGNANVTLTSLTIQNGLATAGGGILLNGGVLQINDSRVQNNTATAIGGGIENNAGTVIVTNVSLQQNSAGISGGGLHSTGSAVSILDGAIVTDNTAGEEGGGAWNSRTGVLITRGSTTVNTNTASGAAADQGGGGIFNDGGRLAVQAGTTISNNVADGAAGSGGGIFTANGVVTVDNSTITNNTAKRAGGGVEFVTGIIELTNSTLDNNQALGGAGAPGNGGGLHVTGRIGQVGYVRVIGGTVSGNTAATEGGGLWNQAGNIMVVRGGAVINGNTAFGNAADDGGGGIFNNNGRLAIGERAVISNNRAVGAAGSGGGIFSAGSGVSIEGEVTIINNSANRAGGGIEVVNGELVIVDSTIIGNLAGPAFAANSGDGGGIHVSGGALTRVDLRNTLVTGNSAAHEGGGLWLQAGSVMLIRAGTRVTANIASGNGADDGGGGIFNNGGRLVINNATIDTNRAEGIAGSGGGLFLLAGVTTIEASTITDNMANRAGGGIEIVNGLLLTLNMDLSDNDAGGVAPNPGNGGGLHVTGNSLTRVTIVGGTVSGNTAANEGGGLWNQAGSIMVVSGGATISRNTASGDAAGSGGGGIFNNGGRLAITSSSIWGNSADGTSGDGGGILSNGGGVTLDNSTVSGNTANGDGGGIVSGGELIAANATIANNRANADGANGGSGGGLNNAGLVTLNNTIVAGNLIGTGSAINDISGNTVRPTSRNNLISHAASAGGLMDGVNGNIIGNSGAGFIPISSILVALANNGGPSLTHALVINSPAIDAGENSLAKDTNNIIFTNDQRGFGFPRIKNGTVDIGAFED